MTAKNTGGRTGPTGVPRRPGDAAVAAGGGRALLAAAAHRYDGAGPATRRFVCGKLRGDPVYRALLDADLPRRGRLLDLGCGHGIALAVIAAARPGSRRAVSGAEVSDGGRRLAGGAAGVSVTTDRRSPDVRSGLELVGIERSARRVAVARRALGGEAEVREADLTTAELPSCDAALLLDVLHYLGAAEQEALLDRTARALASGGVLLIREADAARGPRFALTRLQERVAALLRGHWRQRFRYRAAAEWERLLAERGLVAETRPMSRGTPFANVLIVARRTVAPAG